MKRRYLLFLVFLLAGEMVFAQKLTPEVTASAGGHAKVGNYSLDWTLGETATSTDKSGNYTLTQGFHQPGLLTIIGSIDVDLNVDVQVYPNPVLAGIHIKTSERGLSYKILDAEGKEMVKRKQLSKGTQYVDLSNASTGVLLLQIIRDHHQVKLVKIEKLQ